MLAVFQTGGNQYPVKAGQVLKVERLEGDKGDNISFNDVLLVSDTTSHTIGSPLIKGARVQAKILEQIRDKKIIVFKKRRRQNYRHTQGHRQYLTVLKIESIALGDKKTSASTKKIPKVKSLVKEKNTTIKTSTKKKTVTKKNSSIKKKIVKQSKTK